MVQSAGDGPGTGLGAGDTLADKVKSMRPQEGSDGAWQTSFRDMTVARPEVLKREPAGTTKAEQGRNEVGGKGRA